MIDKTTKPKGESNMALAKKIGQAIKASGLTAKEVARQCGITPQAVSAWKRTGTISKEMLPIFADIVKTPLAYFISPISHEPKGKKSREASKRVVEVEKIIQLISLYGESTEAGQEFILNAAARAEKRTG